MSKLALRSDTTPVIKVSVGAKFRVGVDGAPLVPIRNSADRLAIEKLAKAFDAEIVTFSGIPAPRRRSTGTVAALGSDALPAAQVFAHLTCRNVRLIDSLQALEVGALPTVLVTNSKLLDNRLLEILYNSRPYAKTAPGIIAAGARKDLYNQALSRGAVNMLASSLLHERTDLNPLDKTGFVQVTKRLGHCGGSAGPTRTRKLLSAPRGLLKVMSHADGIDAYLGPLILCGRKNGDYGNARRAPRCVATGHCHRAKQSAARALRSNALVSPNEIAAQVLIFDVCWGLMPSGGVMDSHWGFGYGLISNPAVGLLFMPWEVVVTDPGTTEALVLDIQNGTSAGVALARHNHREKRRFGHRMCLFGDPAMRFIAKYKPQRHKGSVTANKQRTTKRANHSLAENKDPANNLRILQDCFFWLEKTDAIDNIQTKPVRRAIEAINDLRVAMGSDGRSLADAQIQTRKAVYELFQRRGKLFDTWLATSSSHKSNTRNTCHHCDRRSVTITACFQDNSVQRCLKTCPVCGVTLDAPVGAPIQAVISKTGNVSLQGNLPANAWTGAIVLGSPFASETIIETWPSNRQGQPRKQFRIRQLWPPGALRLNAFFSWEQTYMVTSRMVLA